MGALEKTLEDNAHQAELHGCQAVSYSTGFWMPGEIPRLGKLPFQNTRGPAILL